jgi:CCR4-NOT transcription complex subunit 2
MSGSYREEALGKLSPGADAASQSGDGRNSLGAIGIDGAIGKQNVDDDDQDAEVVDPLAGMAEVDKWGIKGLRTLMNNYPDYHAMVVGMDPGSLGLDMSSSEYGSPCAQLCYRIKC